MPKFSQIPTNTSPSLSDFLIGVSAGAVDQKTTLAVLAALFAANTPAGTVTPAMLASNLWGWEILGTPVTVSGGSNPTTLDSGTFVGKKYIRILVVQHSGGATLTSGMRFNNDGATNYAYRTTENGGADSTATSQTWLQMGSNALEGMHMEMQVVNEAAYRKIGHAIETFWDTAGALYRNTYAGYWQNSSNLLTRVQLLATLGSFKNGSSLIVLGRDQ